MAAWLYLLDHHLLTCSLASLIHVHGSADMVVVQGYIISLAGAWGCRGAAARQGNL